MSKAKTQTEAPAKVSPSPAAALMQTPAPQKANAHAAPQQASSNSAPPPSQGAARMLSATARTRGAADRARTATFMQRSVGNTHLSRLMGLCVQPKLTVSQPDDVHEREADHVAEALTQPEPKPVALAGAAPVQRQSAPSANEPAHAVDAHMEDRIGSPGVGQSLPDGVRREMETGLGADFSRVRVHNTREDQSDADRLNAKAFTHGSDIWLGSGASANDRKLMAHELTHVVQQGGATQRKPIERTPKPDEKRNEAEAAQATSSDTLASRKVTHTGSSSIQRQVGLPLAFGLPALAGYELAAFAGKKSTYELKGSSKFEPNIFLQAYIHQQDNQALVDVRFGNLASGKMYIERRGDEYYAPPTALPMTHPEISSPGGGQTLSLVVSIGPGNEITGSAGVTKPLPPNSMGAAYGSPEDQERFLTLLIGESGTKGKLENYAVENELKNGHLNVRYTFVNKFHKGTYLVGAIVMIDEAFAFSGSLHTSGKGLVASDTPVERDKRGSLIGNREMSTSWDGNAFTGKLSLTYEDGVLEISGHLLYVTARAQGELSVVVTEESRAWQAIQAQLAAVEEGPNPLGGPKPAAGGAPPDPTAGAGGAGAPTANVEDGLALSGWGVLKLTVTNKIEADAGFVVDPDGYITVRGTIRSPHKIILMDAKPTAEKTFFEENVSKMFYVIWAAGVRVRVDVSLKGKAVFGPLTLHDITITGLYSTRPEANKELQISAKLNLSGSATLTLAAKGEVAARIGLKYDWTGANVASVTLDTSATAEARGVVEATPTIKIQGGGAADAIPKYVIGGELFIGGEVDLKLTGDLIFDAPALHKEIHLGDKVYPIAGFGLTTNLAYTVGSDEPPEVNYKKGAFEPARFMRQVVQEKRPTDAENEAQGSFKEEGKEKGHVIPSDVVPDAPPREPKTQVVEFSMEGTRHTLFLTLGGPNAPALLEMASRRGPLKPKIAKAEKELLDAKDDFLTSEVTEKQIDRRVTDLEQAEAETTRVEQAAAKLGAEPEASSIDTPGLRELANRFEVYADRYNVTDLAAPTPGQLTFPSQPSAGTGTDTEAEDVMSSWANLKKDQQVIDQVRRILDTGQVPQGQFKQIMDKAKINGAPARRLLDNLEQMTNRRIAGLKVVLSDLEIGGNKFSGANFMLAYIGDNGLWDSVTKFESPAEDRRVDAIIRRTDYEFKNWGEFRSGTFLEQIKKDYDRKDGLRAVRWVFKRRELGDKAAIIQLMTDALNDVPLGRRYKINRTQAREIIDELDRIVIVH